MKTSPLLLPLGVAVLAGSLLFLSGHPRPAPAATTARTIAARPALAITDPAPPRPPPAHSRASSNANDTADLVADQRLLQQVLPSLDRPVTDWRRFTPAKLTVVPAPGLPLEFTATSITTGGARTTWIGTNPEQGTTLVASATETLWDAIVTVPGADEYSIHLAPDSVRVIETAHGLHACGPASVVSHK